MTRLYLWWQADRSPGKRDVVSDRQHGVDSHCEGSHWALIDTNPRRTIAFGESALVR
jgi:hypothetical protein